MAPSAAKGGTAEGPSPLPNCCPSLDPSREPVAAALAYGIDLKEDKTVMVTCIPVLRDLPFHAR